MPNCVTCGGEYTKTKRHSKICLACRRVYDKAWRAKRKSEGNPVISTKMPMDYHANYEREYRERPGVRDKMAENMRRYYADPHLRVHKLARVKLQKAVLTGKVERLPCSVCGNPKSDGHHKDYSKPLDVIWLCRKHHAEEHAKAEVKHD